MDKNEAKNLVRDLLELLAVKVKDISLLEQGDKNTIISVEVEEPRHFMDRGGEGLQALNHLVHRILEGKNETMDKRENNILVDINNFEKKHIENIQAVAHMMSERARYFRSNIEIDPMTAFERRIVHEFLASAEDLKTESVGTGRSRRVIIKYIGSI